MGFCKQSLGPKASYGLSCNLDDSALLRGWGSGFREAYNV